MLPGAFTSLPAEVQAQLTAAGRSGRWARGGLIFHPDDPAETLHLVTRGTVRLYRLGSGAREVTLDVHGPGALLGTPALLRDPDSAAAYGMYAEAMDEVAVPVPPGTPAPPRPPGKERVATLPVTEPFEIFTEALTDLEPGAAGTMLYSSGLLAISTALLTVLAPGDEVTIDGVRDDAPFTRTVTVGPRPDDGERGYLGVTLAEEPDVPFLIQDAADAVELLLQHGLEIAQNQVHSA